MSHYSLDAARRPPGFIEPEDVPGVAIVLSPANWTIQCERIGV
jgi:hypothetical protein